MSIKNPPWSKEELVLALDFYFENNPLHINANNAKLLHLCSQINLVNEAYCKLGLSDNKIERSPNSVYMKLCNFLRLDPDYSGVGLYKGSKLEETVWKVFYDNKLYLNDVCNSILKALSQIEVIRKDKILTIHNIEVNEGTLILSYHKMYERNPKIVKAKKALALKKNGEFSCEICGFNFEKMYGKIGLNYIECHHIVPLHKYSTYKMTSLDDLILVCANCHRMLHNCMNTITPDELREAIKCHG